MTLPGQGQRDVLNPIEPFIQESDLIIGSKLNVTMRESGSRGTKQRPLHGESFFRRRDRCSLERHRSAKPMLARLPEVLQVVIHKVIHRRRGQPRLDFCEMVQCSTEVLIRERSELMHKGRACPFQNGAGRHQLSTRKGVTAHALSAVRSMARQGRPEAFVSGAPHPYDAGEVGSEHRARQGGITHLARRSKTADTPPAPRRRKRTARRR